MFSLGTYRDRAKRNLRSAGNMIPSLRQFLGQDVMMQWIRLGRISLEHSITMKPPQSFAPLAVLCAVATFAGCASPERQRAQSAVGATNFNHDGTVSAAASSPSTLPRAVSKAGHEANERSSLDEWKRLDTNAQAEGHSSALDQNGDGQVSPSEPLQRSLKPLNLEDNSRALDENGEAHTGMGEFLHQASKHSWIDHLFNGTMPEVDRSPPAGDFDRQPGLRLFSVPF